MDSIELNNNPEFSQEELQQQLWDALEKVVPNPEHEDNKKLELVKEKYSFISYSEALEEMGSVDDREKSYIKNYIKNLTYTKDISPDQCLFMKAVREDGENVYAVIGVGAVIKYRADFLSPAYYEGHGSNHDYNSSELLGNLYLAVTAPPHPESK